MPRVRDGRGSRISFSATTAIAKPGQPDLPVWNGSLKEGELASFRKDCREPPDLVKFFTRNICVVYFLFY
jgi:hypothetical protein